jgi:transposase
LFCQRLSFRKAELYLNAFLYHDPERETEERMNLHHTLMQNREKIEKLQVRKGLGTAITAIAGSYMKDTSYTVKDNKIITKARNNAITAAENRIGRFMLVYSGNYDPVTCLSIYRQKDAIEKDFMILKTDIDLFPIRARKHSTVRGTIFVQLIALILRSMIVRAMNLSGLTKKYSVERMFLELEKLQIVKKDDGTFEELERTKKQRDILTALEKISWGQM